MKFTYDPRHNIAYIRFHEKGKEVEAIRISDELIVDMAPDGTSLRYRIIECKRTAKTRKWR